MDRRKYLTTAGLTLAAPLVGCLGSAADPRETDEPTASETEMTPDNTMGPEDGPSDMGDFSIKGRLHNETDTACTFTVTITDVDGNTVVDNEQTVGPHDTYPVPAAGQPNTAHTVAVTANDTTSSETFEFDVEPTPQKIDGYIDITYTSGRTLEIEFTSLEGVYNSSAVIEEEPRVDTPPYDIEEPEPPEEPSNADEWNEEYLGENQETSPSLAFDRIEIPTGAVAQQGFREFSGSAYWVELISSERARDVLLNLDELDEQTREQLTSIDFAESVLVVVQTGYGSGSVSHRWSRVESTEDGLHLHGYYTDPYMQTADLTSWVSLLKIDRPSNEIALARTSLTVATDHRVNFNSTEGLVTLDAD